MKKTLAVLALSCALAAAITAQALEIGPYSPQDRVKFMTAQLGLTVEQQAQAATIFGKLRAAESTVRANLRTAHQGLSAAAKSDNIAGAKAAFYQVLTPEQRTKLDQLESQRMRGAWRFSRADGQ